MKVLVTGATGFLGRHLVKKLKTLNYEVSISNSKIANLFEYKNLEIFDDKKFDYIFHLAAKTKAGDWCKYHKGEQWIDNQIINTNILKYWSEKQPQAKLISFGTSCSYGPSEYPMYESDYMMYSPDNDLYTYAMTKRMLLVGCESLANQYGLKYVHYIPSTLYGIDFDAHDTHFIFDLIKKIVRGKYEGAPVELWGNGHQKRELVYVDDVVNIILNGLHLNNEVVNISSGKDYTIRDFAKIICDMVDYPINNIIYDETKFTGVKRKTLDITKLKLMLDKDFKFTELNVGVKNTIDYYLNEIYANS
jgi:GDP-L-fucose synthase